MSTSTSARSDGLEATEVVEHSLLPVPESARTSTAAHQFWIWTGANTAPINWVLGALGIQIGLSLWQTIGVLVAGNLIGMSVFGLFVLMGQETGVSQMVLSRSAFGRRGAYLPAAMQGLLAVGWCAVNTWIVLDLVLALFGKLGVTGGTGLKVVVAAVIMAIQVVIAGTGFRAIARFERWTVPVTLAVLLAMTVAAWTRTGVDWGYRGEGLSGTALWSALSTIMTAIGIGWGITWFAYASDYSRFVPRTVPRSRVFLASVAGQFLPTVWLGVFGATLATAAQTVDPGQLVVQSFGALAIPVLLLVLHGPIATNVLNLYSCALCAQTLDWQVDRRKLTYGVGVLSFLATLFLISRENFATALDGWLAGLVTWVAPWAAVMLVHFYARGRREVDVDALFAPVTARRMVDVSWPAVTALVVGMVATWSAEYGIPGFLQGPLAKAMGGVDLSWLVGSVVAALVYVALRPGTHGPRVIDLLVRGARLPGSPSPVDVHVDGGRIVALPPTAADPVEARTVVDADGALLSPPYVEPHVHLDTTLTAGEPRWNESGTLWEGIACWAERKPSLTREDVLSRVEQVLRWYAANGTLHVRSHVDVTDPSFTALDALLELRDRVRDVIGLQLVAFPQEGVCSFPDGEQLLEEAARRGVDAIGAIPHYEDTREDGVRSVEVAVEIAERYGLRVDAHCDETDDEHSRFVEVLATRAARTGLRERVTASHTTAMGGYGAAYSDKLRRIIVRSGIHLVSNPLVNLHLQGRFDGYPKRRGLTQVKEMLAAGVNVAFGHDDVMDPWYPMGTADPVQVAFVGAHATQLTSPAEVAECFRMVTDRAADVLGLGDRYGVAVGRPASFLLLPALDPFDVVRRQVHPSLVVAHGRVLATRPPSVPTLTWPGREPEQVDFLRAGEQAR